MRSKFCSFLLSILAVSSAVAQGPARMSAEQRSRLAAVVQQYMDARHIPGLSLAIGAEGHLLLAEGLGQADLEHGITVTPATLFGLQSTQKLLTATAVLRLAQDGRLRLTDQVARYCPAFGVRRWRVSLRDLLAHQGGIRPSDLRDMFNREHYPSTGAALRRFARDSLRYRPGTQVVYSNAGYTLLACAIEGATGRPYDSTLARLVLQPAGMRSTRPDNVFEVIHGRTRYYIVRTRSNTDQWAGLWTPAHLAGTRLDQPANADPVDPSWAIGAGSYLGTPADLVRFGLALMDGRLLSSAYRDTSLSEVSLAGTQQLTGRTLGNWVMDPDHEGVRRALGSSWNGSFGLALLPRLGLVVAIASNIELDQPADLVARIMELWGSAASLPH